LNFLLDQRLSTIPQHQWLSKLIGYDFRVEYRLGRFNMVAEALSRRDGDSPLLAALRSVEWELAVVSVPTFQLFADIRREMAESADLRAFRDEVAAGNHGPD